MKKIFLLLLLLNATRALPQAGQWTAQPPDKLYGQLFKDVQMARIFPDGKTFVDCVPKMEPQEIVREYLQKRGDDLDLKAFVSEHFELPRTPQINYITKETDVVMHIRNLWNVLRRDPDKPVEGSSLLPLPYPYIVPGGRFREIYYWDSYFTMLGLKESGRVDMIENMLKNFAYLIQTYGHIPNGNRSYYLSRSQAPFFALMVELLADIRGDSVYVQYLPALKKEYEFWMDGAASLRPGTQYRRVVRLPDSSLLNRYWDDYPEPRQESYREDVETAIRSGRDKKIVYTNLRAGAESGIDFSSRWLADGKSLSTIRVTDMIPVDLNCLLYKLELVIARAELINGNDAGTTRFRALAEKRRKAIDKYCWNRKLKFYCDYNFVAEKPSDVITPAGLYPFCVYQQNLSYMSLLARQAAVQVREKLLQPGGVCTTANTTGQQWDAPNGWAPLEWMTVWGLDRCGQRELAREIAERWLRLNINVFNRTGRMMEKYNVVDLHLDAGGGEYPGQDGFGWTNGVFLALMGKYGMPEVTDEKVSQVNKQSKRLAINNSK
ncbi:MAG TPA: alpha,alpha-trehalase TreF [Chitinophagaceae bacterium]|nr:alpha,alpha-trehalase TreF [Chitinophagaceae bacterium]